MALPKRGRMSIDRTIYFDKGLVSPTVTPVPELAPIHEERFSEHSGVGGLAKLPKKERLTNDSTVCG